MATTLLDRIATAAADVGGVTRRVVGPDVERRARLALHHAVARLPDPPGLVSPARPLARPPRGSGLKTVMGDFGYPGVGWMLNSLYGSPLHYMDQVIETYGRVSWSGMAGRRIVNVLSAEGIRQILVNREGHWSNELGWDWIIGPFFHRGIMLLDDPDHHRDRRIMQQAFTRRRLEAYLARLAPVTATAIERWGAGPMHVYPVLKQLTLDVATDVFLDEELEHRGRRGESQADAVNQAFIDCVRAGTGVVRTDVPFTRWHRGLEGRALLEAYFQGRLATHRASDGDDLLTALCQAESEDGQSFSDEDVVNHIIFLMMAAHDTSTISVNAILWFLVQHPGWQERCREESLALDSDVLDLRAIGALESLDLVMKEALRMIPPVFGMGRMPTVDTEVDGWFVPAGVATQVTALGPHYDPELWSSPHQFDPERFAEHRREDRSHPYAYLPFGGGAHKCIGMHFGQMEVKTILHQLLRRYRVVAARTEIGTVATDWDWTSLPKPLDDLPVILRPL